MLAAFPESGNHNDVFRSADPIKFWELLVEKERFVLKHVLKDARTTKKGENKWICEQHNREVSQSYLKVLQRC